MKVLKYTLIGLGILLAVAFWGAVGFGVWWTSSIDAVELTAADIEAGTPFAPEERTALIEACGTHQNIGPDGCECIAGKAAELSRYERLFLTASLKGDPAGLTALVKGLINPELPQEKFNTATEKIEERFKGIMAACGLTSG